MRSLQLFESGPFLHMYTYSSYNNRPVECVGGNKLDFRTMSTEMLFDAINSSVCAINIKILYKCKNPERKIHFLGYIVPNV